MSQMNYFLVPLAKVNIACPMTGGGELPCHLGNERDERRLENENQDDHNLGLWIRANRLPCTIINFVAVRLSSNCP